MTHDELLMEKVEGWCTYSECISREKIWFKVTLVAEDYRDIEYVRGEDKANRLAEELEAEGYTVTIEEEA